MVFVSNYLNHHQIPLCTQLKSLCDEFTFIATDTKNIQGYQHISDADYVIEYNDDTNDAVIEIIQNADVVIFGSTPNCLITERMKSNRLSFLYSERFYKRGVWRCVNPKSYKFFSDRIGKYRHSNMYVLCASAFMPLDLKLLRFPTSKCYRWGYFPDVVKVEPERIKAKKKASLIWAGRLIGWKHPEMAVYSAIYLKKKEYEFTLTIVGDGPLREELEKMVLDNHLENNISFLGSCSHEDVLKHMQETSIFLFTSSKMEGWGAVLNEAMGSACVPVCSHLIGSVPFLIKNGSNGLIYEQGNQRMLNKQVEYLINNEDECLRMGNNAYDTIHNVWNAKVAAQRVVTLCQSFLHETDYSDYSDGPCSKASFLTENWRFNKGE